MTSAYRQLLESVREAGDGIGTGQLTSHWPLVGTQSERLLVVGQAVYGWIPRWDTDGLAGRGLERVLEETQLACYERLDPMSWIEENRVRSSPFWRMVRHTVEAFWPHSAAQWFSHVAWTNLYPIAPNEPKGNPSGRLLDLQTAPAAKLLVTVARELSPRGVLILGGPLWWPFQRHVPLQILARTERPLLARGIVDSQPWIVGMHPAGAQRRGWSADKYAQIAANLLANEG